MQPRIKINKCMDSREEALLWNKLAVYVQLARTGISMKGRTKDPQAREHKMEAEGEAKKRKNTTPQLHRLDCITSSAGVN